MVQNTKLMFNDPYVRCLDLEQGEVWALLYTMAQNTELMFNDILRYDPYVRSLDLEQGDGSMDWAL